MIDRDDEHALLDLERQGWDALCNGTGAAFYGAVMTDDGVMALANGTVMDRQGVVASLNQAPPWRTFEISDVRFVAIGADSAAIVYVGTAYREEPHPVFVGIMSSVYVQRNGEWRLALYQQTPRSTGGG